MGVGHTAARDRALDPRNAANGGRGMLTLTLITLAAMAPVFLMMWFDDIEARHERERERERGSQAAPKPEAKP